MSRSGASRAVIHDGGAALFDDDDDEVEEEVDFSSFITSSDVVATARRGVGGDTVAIALIFF